MTRALFLLLLVGVLGACAPRFEGAGLPMGPPMLTETHFQTADGTSLPLQTWAPKGPPKAVLLAVHGFNDYSHFFDMPGGWLAEQGVLSLAYDQRHFGANKDPGRWAGAATYQADLRAAAIAIKARYPGVPFYILGESMGGAIVMTALAGVEPPLADGIILSAPAVWARETMPFYQTAVLWLAVRVAPGLKLSGKGLNIWPSDNMEMLKALGADPLFIKKTRVDTLHGLVDLMDQALESASAQRGPMLILYGAKDQIVPAKPTAEMLRRLAPGAGIQVAIYPNGYHMLLRDLQADVVWRDILHWIETPGVVLPSGSEAHAPCATPPHPLDCAPSS
ncbi:MAG: lysophospholipase [Magnetospiraceae bacterium]